MSEEYISVSIQITYVIGPATTAGPYATVFPAYTVVTPLVVCTKPD